MSQSILANKKLIGLLVSLVIVTGTVSWGAVWINDNKKSTVEILEDAEFVVSDIDVMNITENDIFFNLTGMVLGLSTNETFDFEITKFQIVFDYNTTPLTIDVDPSLLSERSMSSELEFSFITSLGMSQLGNSGSTDLVGAIISGQHVDIPFKGILNAKVFGFTSEISFLNSFKFRTSRALSFNVTKIENPKGSTSTDSTIGVEIINPFSSSFKISGTIEVGLGDLALGIIPVTEPITIEAGGNNISLPLTLHQSYQETMQSIISSSNFTIWANGDIVIFGSTETLSTQTVFTVGGEEGTLPLDWEIDDFDLQDYDPISGDGKVVFNLTVINNLPISFPIERLEMTLATLSGTEFTKVTYNGNRITIPLFGLGTLLNVSGELNGVNAFLLARISEDGAISVPNVTVTIFTSSDSFNISFSIPRLDLNIIL